MGQTITKETGDHYPEPELRDVIPELKKVTLKAVAPLNNELGRGAYGSVFTVQYGGVTYAAKKIHPILIESVSSEERKRIKDDFIQECLCCSSIRHPNIVQFVGVYYTNQFNLPIMVMELMDASLTSFVKNNKSRIEFGKKISILHDVSVGLNFLHTHKPQILHRDLSSNNVMIMLTTKLVAKIGDLGVAKMVQADNRQTKSKLTTAPGTLHFMPPEALVDENPVYGTSIDVFSFGGIAIHVFSEEWPTPSAPKQIDPVTEELIALSEAKRRQKYLDKLTGRAAGLREMVERCLSDNPNKRPPIQEVSASIEPLKVHATDDDDMPNDVITDDDNMPNDVINIKKNTANVVIGKPANLVHMAHVGSDGTRWSSKPNSTDISSSDQNYAVGSTGEFENEMCWHAASMTLRLNTYHRKKNTSNSLIGKPTNLVHMAHIGSDGTQWSSKPNSTDIASSHQNLERSYTISRASHILPQPTVDSPENEMRKRTASMPSGYYDTQCSRSMTVNSKTYSQLGHPVPNFAAPVITSHADRYISSNDDGNSKLSPFLTSSPHVKRPSGEYARLIDVVKEQLPQACEEHCMEYLTKNNGNVELTLQDLKVQILMDMKLANTNIDSCRKALSHCQWKLDRAAEWLIEQNLL